MTTVRVPRHDIGERPLVVIWECTRACALACRHCRAEAQPQRDPFELSTDEAVRLARDVASFGMPAPLFVITGGDPFDRPDLFEIVERAAREGLRVAVSPSGTPSLTEANLATLYEAGATSISLSIDGSNAQVHDSFRGVAGVFDWTINGWDAARRLGLRVQVNTSVTRHNLDDLPAIVELVARHGATTWSAFLLVPTGRGSALGALEPHEVEDVLNFVYDAGAFVPARTTEAPHFRRVALQRHILAVRGVEPVAALGLGPLYERLAGELAERMARAVPRPRRPPMDVSAARGFVFVSHHGDVHPSGFLPINAGNVRERPLVETYRDAELFRQLRTPEMLRGNCGRCEFRAVCGGSRARAYGVTGDPFATEPWCAYEPGSFPFADDVAALLRDLSRPKRSAARGIA